MGLNPIPLVPPRRKPKTAIENVQEQYARGERDVAGLERAVEWLIRHGLDEKPQHIAPHWPPEDPDGLPTSADPLLVNEIEIP